MQSRAKIYFCILGLTIMGAAQAQPKDVITQPPHDGWQANVELFYFEPNNQDLITGFNNQYYFYDGIATFLYFPQRVKVNSGWGYKFDLGYQFDSSPNDAHVNLLHFSHSGHLNGADYDAGFHLRGDTENNNFSIFESSASFDFKAINVEYGDTQQWRQWTLRTFFGLQYVDFRHDLRALGYNNFETEVAIDTNWEIGDAINSRNRMRFKGLGPRLGVDAQIPLAYGFNFVGTGAIELLVGSLRSQSVTDFFGIREKEGCSVLIPESFRTIVPGFEAKMGINYVHEDSSGIYKIEGGYKVIDYVHMVRHEFAPGDAAPNGTTHISDFGMHGVYFGISAEI